MDVRAQSHRTRSTLLLTALLGLIASFAAAPARAVTPYAQIDSTGPIEHIYAGNELSCQLKLLGDSVLSTYPETIIPGDCGTLLRTGPTLYIPSFSSHGNTATTTSLPGPKTPYTPVSQTPVTGSGTGADPFTVTTVADAGSTGLRVTQIDSYVTGANSYLSEITVSNSGASQTASLYHAADCFLAGTDTGYGYVQGANAVFCAANPNNSPSGRILGFEPADAASSGATYLENRYDLLWNAITGSPFPNTCACGTLLDNGAGLQWDISIPASGSVTRKVRTTLFAPPRISIADRNVTEGDTQLTRGASPPTELRFVVSLAAPSDGAVSVDFATADGSATSPADYAATNGTISFPAGKTRRVVTVPINGDTIDEPNESFTVGLSNPTGGATIEDGTATGKIIDDDGPPTISIGDSSRREGLVQRLPVTLTAASGKTVRVSFQTADGDALAPDDYASRSGTLTFQPGQTARTVNITTVQDSAQENPETFTVELSAPVNAVLGNTTGTATIENDDPD